MKRLAWVDTGRGIAIVLVALFHATNWMLAAGFDLHAAVRVNEVLSSVRMPLFFAISGLFAAKWLEGLWRSVLREKVLLFLWVYAVWEVVGTVVGYYGMGLNGDRSSVAHTVYELMMSPFKPRFELWFMWALAIFFVLAKLTRRVSPTVQLAVAGAVSLAALSGWQAPNVGWGGALKYYAFFLAGIYLRDLIFAFSRIERPVLLTGVVAVWAGSGTALVAWDLQDVPGLYFANCVLGMLAGVCLGRVLSRVRVLPYLGSRTLQIYLAHTPLIVGAALALDAVDAAGRIGDVRFAVAPGLMVCAIALSLLLHRTLMGAGATWFYQPPRALIGILQLARRDDATRSSGTARASHRVDRTDRRVRDGAS